MAISVLHISVVSDGLMSVQDNFYPLPSDAGKGFLRVVEKPRFILDELDPGHLQNQAVIDMMRHPPLDESGFDLESLS